MAIRKPLVVISGSTSELPPGDTVEGVIYTTILTAGSGLSGGGSLATDQRVDVSLAAAPSGLIFVGTKLGIDGVTQADVTALRAQTITAGSGLLGGGNLSASRRIDANVATQAVAQSGTDNTTLMTPLRVAQAINAAGLLYTYSSTNVNKTLLNLERCTVTSGSVTLTLPAGPVQGNEVSVIVPSSPSVNVVLSGAGSAIMGLQQNLTIDSVDKTVTLIYIDATNGWRIF